VKQIKTILLFGQNVLLTLIRHWQFQKTIGCRNCTVPGTCYSW